MSFANIDAANKFKNISRDAKAHDCSLQSLAPATVKTGN